MESANNKICYRFCRFATITPIIYTPDGIFVCTQNIYTLHKTYCWNGFVSLVFPSISFSLSFSSKFFFGLIRCTNHIHLAPFCLVALALINSIHNDFLSSFSLHKWYRVYWVAIFWAAGKRFLHQTNSDKKAHFYTVSGLPIASQYDDEKNTHLFQRISMTTGETEIRHIHEPQQVHCIAREKNCCVFFSHSETIERQTIIDQRRWYRRFSLIITFDWRAHTSHTQRIKLHAAETIIIKHTSFQTLWKIRSTNRQVSFKWFESQRNGFFFCLSVISFAFIGLAHNRP